MDNLKNQYASINKIVNGYRTFALIVITVSLLTSLCLGGMIYVVSQNKIMVVDAQGDILSASKASEQGLFEIEADNHIRLFYSRFFTYDKTNYKKQINSALLIAGVSAANLFETYTLKGWFDNVITNDLKIESYVQKVSFTNLEGTVNFNAIGFQKVIRGNIVEVRHLDIKGTVTKKSSGREIEINPHGMELDNIVITNNQTIQNENQNDN